MFLVTVQSLSGSCLLGPEIFPPNLSVAELRARVWAQSSLVSDEACDEPSTILRSFAIAPLEVKLILGATELMDGETLKAEEFGGVAEITGLFLSAETSDGDEDKTYVNPNTVGRSFATKYYKLLKEDPSVMHKFYKQ